jgi:hypothetical protein
MESDSKRKPIFGAASIAAPTCGVLGGFLIIYLHPKNTADFGGLGAAVLFLYSTFLVGFLFSIIAFVRRERRAYLFLVGIVANAIPILAALFHYLI